MQKTTGQKCEGYPVKELLVIISDKLDDVQKEQISQGKTLVRQSTLLGEHLKREDAKDEVVEGMDDRIGEIENHVKKVDKLIVLFTPTTKKIAGFVAVCTALVGFYAAMMQQGLLKEPMEKAWMKEQKQQPKK